MTKDQNKKMDWIESQLEHREEARSLALEGNGIGLWDWDIVSNELWWDENMFELFGNHKHSFSGEYSDFIGRVHPEDQERVQQSMDEALANRTHYFVSYRVMVDGVCRTIIARGAVTFDEHGDPLRMAGICIQQEGFIPLINSKAGRRWDDTE